MPPVVAAIATAAASAAGSAALASGSLAIAEGVAFATYAVVEVGIYAGVAALTAALTAPKVPDPASLQIPLKQPMAPRQSAFGRVRVAGTYALYTVGSGAYKTLSYDILALLDGQSHQLVNFYLNDDLMAENSLDCWFAPGAFGKYGQGTGLGNLVNFDYKLGNPTEVAYTISAQTPVWTSDHRGDGVTSMLLRCKQAHKEDQSACFPNGVPSPSAVLDAQLIWDPRDSSQTQGSPSTYTFSDNPALCLLAYMTDASGGMGLDYSRFLAPTIDELAAVADECDAAVGTTGMHATLAAAAAAGATTIYLADTSGLTVGTDIEFSTETVTVSSLGGAGAVGLTSGLRYSKQAGDLAYWAATGLQARYRCAGTYRHDNAPGDVIKSILSTFDGWMGQRGDGAIVVRSNTIYEPGLVLTDRHILGYQVQHYLPDEQAVNQYIVSFTDPAAAFNKGDAGVVQDDADIAARGQLRSQPLDLSWAPSGPQALAVGRALLARSIQPLRGTLTCNLAGLAVMGERYVRIQVSELPDLNDLIVEVTGRVAIDLSAMTVSFPWIATSVSVGASPGPADSSDTVSVPGPASGGALDPLTAPTIVSVTPDYPDSGGGVSGARLAIVVDDPGFENINWKVRWKLAADSVWTDAAATADAGVSLTLHTGLVPASGSIDVQVAYLTATQFSPWSATTTVTVSAPVAVITASPAAGAPVVAGPGYMYDDAGAAKVVNADATVGDPTSGSYKPCNCWINAPAILGATVSVTMPGQYVAKSSLSPGATYWLAVGGGVATTAPSTSGNLDQVVGTADHTGGNLFLAPQRGIGA